MVECENMTIGTLCAIISGAVLVIFFYFTESGSTTDSEAQCATTSFLPSQVLTVWGTIQGVAFAAVVLKAFWKRRQEKKQNSGRRANDDIPCWKKPWKFGKDMWARTALYRSGILHITDTVSDVSATCEFYSVWQDTDPADCG